MNRKQQVIQVLIVSVFALFVLGGCGEEGDASLHQLLGSTGANHVPAATSRSVATDEDTAVSVVLGGTDADGDTLIFKDISTPGHGVLSGTAPNMTYMPAANYHGSDSFTFRVNDGTVDSAQATVSITIKSVNDAPIANDDTAETNASTAVTINILANDSDPDGTLDQTTVTVSTVAHGTVVVGSDGSIVYTPNSGFVGTETFTYQVKDNEGAVSNTAHVSITVKAAPLSCEEAAGYTVITLINKDGQSQKWLQESLKTGTEDDAEAGLYQWGRAADGHEKRDTATVTAKATTIRPDTGTSWYGKFIVSPDDTEDDSSAVHPMVVLAHAPDWVAAGVDANGSKRFAGWKDPDAATQVCPCGYVVPSVNDYLGLSDDNRDTLSIMQDNSDVSTDGSILRSYYDGSLGSLSDQAPRWWTRNTSVEDPLKAQSFGLCEGVPCVDTVNRGTGLEVHCVWPQGSIDTPETGISCEQDSDCATGQFCSDGTCRWET